MISTAPSPSRRDVAQHQVERAEIVARGRRRLEDHPVELRVFRAEEQVHGGRIAVAATAAAQLIELDLPHRQVVEHHVPDVRDVHALAERARRDHHRDVARSRNARSTAWRDSRVMPPL